MNRRSVLLLLATLVAVIGTALVFVYVRSADNRAQEQFETVEVLVATQTIEAGESIASASEAGKIDTKAIPKNQVLVDALTSTESLKDQVAVTPIYAGEQIIPAKFGGVAQGETLAIPDGMMAISVELSDPYRVAGFVNPGSEVAIFYIPARAPEGALGDGPLVDDRVRVLLKRVLVLGVGSTSTTTTKKTVDETGQQTTSEVPQTMLTIAVSQEDAERVLFAEDEVIDHGEVAFALLTDKSKVDYTRGVGADNIYVK